MPLISRSWTLNRLRGRLQKVERAKDEALQALIVRDEQGGGRHRFDFQDPGQVGSMLDEIAVLQKRIAGMEAEDTISDYDTPVEVSAAEAEHLPAPIQAPLPARPLPHLHPDANLPPPECALDPAFQKLRAELNHIQRTSATGRIGVEELRAALSAALSSPEVLDATFHGLRAEMTRMQRSNQPGRIGLDALREALRAALGGGDSAARVWDGVWPDPRRPGTPQDYDRDGWHWIRAPGKPLVVLSWHADTKSWGHRLGISPQKAAADGLRYYGPCAMPSVAPMTDETI